MESQPTLGRTLARIEERACIGCTLCIAACPVDAIVGAAKLVHTVLAGRCTGCELCLPPCPVDCIALVPRGRAWTAADEARSRVHARARAERLAAPRLARAAAAPPEPSADDDALRARREAIAAAFARARARRAAATPGIRRA
jgi:electron transport complex protein RnfB